MMELFNAVFFSVWTFFGTLMLLATVLHGFAAIVEAWRK
jgi:hypothetical protein